MQSRRWFVVISACLSIFVALAVFKVLQIKAAIAFGESFPEQSEMVEWVNVEEKIFTEQIEAFGEIVSSQTMELRNEIDGKIIFVGFSSGDSIKKGQVLLQLEASEEQAQLKAAQAEVELAQLSLQRLQKLMNNNASSKDQLDQATALHSIAIAKVQGLQAIINKKTLIAPFDAVTGLHQLEVGQYLSANSAITRLVGLDKNVWVDFYLPQQHTDLAKGTEVSITAEGVIIEAIKGKIIAKDAALSNTSRNMHFRAAVPNMNGKLKPGVAVNVAIGNVPQAGVIVVPSTAIRYETSGKFVFVIQSVKKNTVNEGQAATQWRASKRVVTLGAEHLQEVAIIEGLHVGEKVAVNGSYKLREGMLVNLKSNAGGEKP